jgi:uncharacterized protein YcbK (DUF882 family)
VPRLTEHFDSREFRSHDGAALPRWHRAKLRRLCERYLEPLRSEFGPVQIRSGHRSATHNDRVGGAPGSLHLAIAGRRGAAADVACATGAPADWYRFLDELGAPGLGLYATWVHVDTRAGTARW